MGGSGCFNCPRNSMKIHIYAHIKVRLGSLAQKIMGQIMPSLQVLISYVCTLRQHATRLVCPQAKPLIVCNLKALAVVDDNTAGQKFDKNISFVFAQD